MFADRRIAILGAAALVWYVFVLFFWALQPLNDSVPVGVDYTLKPPASVSVDVDCQGLFDSSARGNSPLPTLKTQPVGSPRLAYQRDACGVVQTHARIVFAIDTLAFAAVAFCCIWFGRRRPEHIVPVGANRGAVELQTS